jgi:hypothetical protein
MPKAKMLGIQSPIKIASSEFPLKNNTSEYTNERKAEIKSNLSVSVNFLNIFLNYISYSSGFSECAPFFTVGSGLHF